MLKDSDKRRKMLVVLAAGMIYFLISAVNHYLFRTSALDLGLYTNALYDYAHFSFNDSTTFKETPANLLSDHFDILLLLVSPFSWIFRDWTLLILQIIALLAGGAGVYSYFRERYPDRNLAVPAMAYFYSHFAVLAALGFDFHSNVVAATLLPWFFVHIQRQSLKKAWIVLLFIVLCKENMALWMIFVCIAAAWHFRKEMKPFKMMSMAAALFLYFITITMVIMPALDPGNSFVQFRYSVLGRNYAEAFVTLISEPGMVVKNLFLNLSGDPMGDYIKPEFWLFFLFSGGLFLIARPVWIFMLTPVFLQKLLHDNRQTWGVNDHYSIEMTAVLALGLFEMAGNIRSNNRLKIFSMLVLAMSLSVSVRLMDRTSARVPKENIRLYQSAHWKKPESFDQIQRALSLIPGNAAVSAQSNIHPHLSWRDKAYMFPLTGDAEFIIYSLSLNTYPLNKEEFLMKCEEMEADSLHWEIIYAGKDVRLLKRKLN